MILLIYDLNKNLDPKKFTCLGISQKKYLIQRNKPSGTDVVKLSFRLFPDTSAVLGRAILKSCSGLVYTDISLELKYDVA